MAKARGLAAHDTFYREGRQRIAEASETKGRCFIATLALGDCAETRALRAYLDLVLRRRRAGRYFIGAYYRLSPAACRWLEGRPLVLAGVRRVLKVLASAAGHVVCEQLEVRDGR